MYLIVWSSYDSFFNYFSDSIQSVFVGFFITPMFLCVLSSNPQKVPCIDGCFVFVAEDFDVVVVI